MGPSIGTIRQRLLRSDRPDKFAIARSGDERVHELLGSALAADRSASNNHDGPAWITAALSSQLFRSDVFRLRRRIFVCGLGRARPRIISRGGKNMTSG